MCAVNKWIHIAAVIRVVHFFEAFLADGNIGKYKG
jgi:hypothetical protein